MILNCHSRVRCWQKKRGIQLVECMVYVAVAFILIGMATAAFYHCQTQSNLLRRNAQDIALALKAGERWREDVRKAVRPPQMNEAGGFLVIQHPGGNEIRYAFTNRQVWTQVSTNRGWTVLLRDVKSSKMIVEKRRHVEACHWELELETRQKVVRLLPLFSFLAAPVGKETSL